MPKPSYLKLSRRERQIMDVLYQKGQATAAEIQSTIADPPSYSAVRAKLSIMEDKGYVDHIYDGPRFIYRPIVQRKNAEKTALSHMMDTFYDNSVEKAVTALFEHNETAMSDEQLERLAAMIEKARGNNDE